jgi:hypothetical protein
MMKSAKIILFVLAAGFLVFSFLFILSGFSLASNFLTGILLAGVGFILIVLATRIKTEPDQPDIVNVNVDLPGNVSMDTLKCKSCGGTLAPKDVKLVAGAPVVTCPFCGTTYQLTEEPKW